MNNIEVSKVNKRKNLDIDVTEENKYLYDMWERVLSRCINPRYPSYEDVTCCDEWFTFSSFYEWAKDQVYRGKVLDKDILIEGNREYSPTACCFVEKSFNFAYKKEKVKKDYPLGVKGFGDKYTYLGRDIASGDTSYLGPVDSLAEAEFLATSYRYQNFVNRATFESDKSIKDTLVERYKQKIKHTGFAPKDLEEEITPISSSRIKY